MANNPTFGNSPFLNDESDSFEHFSSEDEALLAKRPRRKKNAVFEKDPEEEDLEKIVFGDALRFRQQLLRDDDLFGRAAAGAATDDDDDDDGDNDAGDDAVDLGLGHVDDADLFIIDPTAGKDGVDPQRPRPSESRPSAAATYAAVEADAPAWEDSDDEKLAISLATASRLRKLRVAEGEDVVSGAEYSKRLRLQFLKLSPLPEWAKTKAKTRMKAKAKKTRAKAERHSSGGGSSSSSSSSSAGSEEEDDDGGNGDFATQPLAKFLRDVNRLTAATRTTAARRALRPETIDIQRSRDVPVTFKDHVTSLSFHPTQPILLSSSPAALLCLHRIDPAAHPTPNPELLSVHPKQVDVRRSEFAGPAADTIFFAGRRPYIHRWDLGTGLVQRTSQVLGHKLEHRSMENFRASPCGRWVAIQASTRKRGGSLNILNATTMQWVGAARLTSRNGIADFAWWADGEGLSILGADGSVGEWSLESRVFRAIWHDEGCIGAIVIALGGSGRAGGSAGVGGDRWVAVGSNSGIVNLYDRTELFGPTGGDGANGTTTTTTTDTNKTPPRPKPCRVLEPLTTPITTLAFSPDGQLLAFGSRWKKDALRLAHLPSCTVYRNWPTQQTPLGRVTAVAFGKHAPVLAIGNDAGKVRLWEIRS